jgi:hypothetical protein
VNEDRSGRRAIIRISLETRHKWLLQEIDLRGIVGGLAGRDL